MSDARPAAESSKKEAFQRFRAYLYLLARSHLGSRYQSRLDPSDIVQQTLLDAHEKQGQFRGRTDAELLGWLKQILCHNVADAVRALARAKRDIGRECSLHEQIGDAFARADQWMSAAQPSPSQQAVLAEELVQMAEALSNLPVVQREAIVLHHLENLSLAEVGQVLQRSPAAVAGLLHRGLKRLRELIPGDGRNSRLG